MSARCIILVVLALAIAAPANAGEYSSGAEATYEYLIHISQSTETGDGNIYTPPTSIDWDYILSKKSPQESPTPDTTVLDSSNLKLLLEGVAVKSNGNQQISDYEHTLDMIRAIRNTANEGDTDAELLFENGNRTRDNLRHIYESGEPSTSSTFIQTYDFSSDNRYLKYLYQRSITSMTSDGGHQIAPSPDQSHYNTLNYQSSSDAEVLDNFTSETYQYEKDTVNLDLSKQTPDGASLDGFNGNEYNYSRSLSNLAHLNSLASDQEMPEVYPSITSNLNILLKDDKEDPAYAIPNNRSNILPEYSLIYSNHSSKKHKSDKIAVVVGINSYSDRMSMHACVNDAKAMAELLGELGYKVVELTDETSIKPTKENILNVAIASIKNSPNTEKAIFYFSGHGEIDENGKFYMVPQNSNGDPSTYISEYDLKRYLKDIENLAIIIDACYSGGMEDFVSEGQMLIASSKNEEPSNELWTGYMSVFTSNLVNAIRAESMRTHGLSLQDCFSKARESTVNWSGQRFLEQNPIIVDKTGGYFCLA